MRKILDYLLFGCVAIITIVACKVDKSAHHQTKYQNQSGVDVKLIGVNYEFNTYFEIQLSDGDSWKSKVGLCENGLCESFSLGVRACDSVCIIFNEDRVLSYTYKDTSDFNPLYVFNYKDYYNKKTNTNTSLFTFTREMYNTATPIEK